MGLNTENAAEKISSFQFLGLCSITVFEMFTEGWRGAKIVDVARFSLWGCCTPVLCSGLHHCRYVQGDIKGYWTKHGHYDTMRVH